MVLVYVCVVGILCMLFFGLVVMEVLLFLFEYFVGCFFVLIGLMFLENVIDNVVVLFENVV